MSSRDTSLPSFGRQWLYRFLLPDGTEVEARELDGNDTAQMYAREELCKAQRKAITIERRSYAGSWEFVVTVETLDRQPGGTSA